MTTNQQLNDYINQQTKLGVSKDTIKSSLLGAGWSENDVTQAITEAESGTQTVAPLTPSQPFSKPAEPAVKSSPVSLVTSDIFRAKDEPVFQSAEINKTEISNPAETKPQIVSSSVKGKPTGSGRLLPIILGVLSAALLSGNIYFFLQNGSLNSKLVALSNNASSVDAQMSSLSNDKKTLSDQINSLNITMADLNNQLSIFALPLSGSTTTVQEVPVNVKGTLRGGGKFLYDVVTNKNIVVHIKNSKDSNVDATLKPLFGTEVEVIGVHSSLDYSLPSITITSVNSQPIRPAQSTNTNTAKASSTSPNTSASTTAPSTGGMGGIVSNTTTTISQTTSTSGTSTSTATSTP